LRRIAVKKKGKSAAAAGEEQAGSELRFEQRVSATLSSSSHEKEGV
jgi:hypothetical protein